MGKRRGSKHTECMVGEEGSAGKGPRLKATARDVNASQMCASNKGIPAAVQPCRVYDEISFWSRSRACDTRYRGHPWASLRCLGTRRKLNAWVLAHRAKVLSTDLGWTSVWIRDFPPSTCLATMRIATLLWEASSIFTHRITQRTRTILGMMVGTILLRGGSLGCSFRVSLSVQTCAWLLWLQGVSCYWSKDGKWIAGKDVEHWHEGHLGEFYKKPREKFGEAKSEHKRRRKQVKVFT